VRVLEQLEPVARFGNENAASDAGVAAWLARGGAEGAVLNVRINLPGVPAGERAELESRAEAALRRAADLHAACVEETRRRIGAAAASA
jgi:formiminotetrahydrofolate cyclodeaminase